MKKLALFTLLLSSTLTMLNAGNSLNHSLSMIEAGIKQGREIPDKIYIINNGDTEVVVNGSTTIRPGHSEYFVVNDNDDTTGTITIADYQHAYVISYPQSSKRAISRAPVTAHLDVRTIRWLALKAQPLDELCIHNDTPYTLKATYALAGDEYTASLEPEEELCKVVSGQVDNQRDIARNAKGTLTLSDINDRSATISFLRRISCRGDVSASDWRGITLSANTLLWLKRGISIRVE